ncbi:LuxR family transcriptional regulator [Actinoplanes couchii]|uniref:Transcriptional regulator n=2 Tax=Actinoplanes couchii TaxID=403638 RepID=A0ABQ3XRQ7_9ACTN|nr:transcriptional regulator [Actinoplanes couchii]
MLVGRESEMSILSNALNAVRTGRGQCIEVHGEAGIGKSTLLEFATDQASGCTVLLARGVESESELAYAGLADLLQPLLTGLTVLSEQQAAELSAALGMGPSATGNRFAVFLAALNLLSRAASERPVLVIVDDFQWFDGESVAAVLFAARRLRAEPVGILLATRIAKSPPGFTSLLLRGLDVTSAATVLTTMSGHQVAPDVAARLTTATGGNPLALTELARLLGADKLTGVAPLTEPVTVHAHLASAFWQSLSLLPTATLNALVVLAASEAPDTTTVTTALQTIGLDIEVLEAAEDAGILRTDGHQVRFTHPLLRSAVYHGATAAARRTAHTALADALGTVGAADRQAWHRASACIGPDPDVADALARVAEEAGRRAGAGAACSALERAAALTVDPCFRAERLCAAAAFSAWAGGYRRAAHLLERAAREDDDAARNQRIATLRASVEMACGSHQLGQRLLADVARQQTHDGDNTGATVSWAGATMAAMLCGDLPTARNHAKATAHSAELARLPAGHPIRTAADATTGVIQCYIGELDQGYPAVRAVLQPGNESLTRMVASVPVFAAHIAATIGDTHHARGALENLVMHQRTAGELGRLPVYLTLLANVAFQDGRWLESEVLADEALELARETGQDTVVAVALGALGNLAAARGEEQCHAFLTEADEKITQSGNGVLQFDTNTARALFHHSTGQPDLALPPLRRLVATAARIGVREPRLSPWLPMLAETLALTGQPDEAATVLGGLTTAATGFSGKALAVVVERCHGMLSADDDADARFHESIQLCGDELPFERARTQLAWGQRLRRRRRRAMAREPLRDAAATFDALRTARWADLARSELILCEGRSEAPPASVFPSLTNQETRVALLVAQGATNREVAASLFLSEKTVEAHLGRAFRKLGVRSRVELARNLPV